VPTSMIQTQQRPDFGKSTKKRSMITAGPATPIRPILLWRFNDTKVTVVIRGNPALASQLGAADMCLTGHESQFLIGVDQLARYQRLLGLSAAEVVQLQRARWWDSDTNPVVSVLPTIADRSA